MKGAVAGTGFIGHEHLKSLLSCGVENPCIFDTCAEKADLAAQKYNGTVYRDYEDMLKNSGIDFVSICTPTNTHYELAKLALEAGVPVLCEKPISSNIEDAQKLIEISERTETLFMIAHVLRFEKQYIYLKRLIESEKYGKLKSLNLFRHNAIPNYSRNGWMKNLEISGGAIMDLHIHEDDIILHLLGKPERIITSGSYNQNSTLYYFEDKDLAVSAQSSWRAYEGCMFTQGFDANFEHAALELNGQTTVLRTEEGNITNPHNLEIYPDYIIPKKDEYSDYTDTIYFDELNTVPYKFRIIERNKIMLKKADYVITYVRHTGNEKDFKALSEKQGKRLINL